MSSVEIDFVSGEEEESYRPRRAKNGSSELKTPRQKYCERWEISFPWLKADKTDEFLGICTVCEKRLVCKKSHLERHQNSYKHQRAMGFEITNEMHLGNENSKDAEAVTADDQYEKYEIEHIEMENEHEVDSANEYSPAIRRMRSTSSYKAIPKKRRITSTMASNKNLMTNERKTADALRSKLLNRIDKERKELNDYYYARQKAQSFTQSPPQQQRDTFDLFFDSISASVKALPLKLGYEFKSKVSQLLAEFELRALCEKEAEEKAASYPNTAAPVIVSPAFEDGTKPMISNVTPVIYSFQTKELQ